MQDISEAGNHMNQSVEQKSVKFLLGMQRDLSYIITKISEDILGTISNQYYIVEKGAV